MQSNKKSLEPCGSRDLPGIPGGGDYWTRTSDLLRVKMRRGRKERAILSFPPLLAQNDLLSAPLVPLSTTCPNSSLGHGLGQALK